MTPESGYYPKDPEGLGQELAEEAGIYFVVKEGISGFDYSLVKLHPAAEGKAAFPLVSDKPLWVLSPEEQESIATITEYFEFMKAIPKIANKIEGLIPWLGKVAKRLEMNCYLLSYEYSPFLIRGDLVKSAKDGKFYLVDPNVVPMGLADMIALKKTYQEGLCSEEEFVGAFKSFIENCGADPDSCKVAIATHLDYGGIRTHYFMADLLTNYGIKNVVSDPRALECQGEKVTVEGQKIDAIWNYTRNLSRINPALYNLWREGKVVIINPPGIRLLETQVWFALLRLPEIQKTIETGGLSVNQLLQLVPETYLVSVVKGSLKVCTDWDCGPIFAGGKETLFPAGFDGEKQRAFIKSLDTSGGKGVEYTSLKKLPDKILRNFGGIALVQEPLACAEVRGKKTKFELYVANNSSAFVPVAMGVMARFTDDGKVHGGTNTLESLVGGT